MPQTTLETVTERARTIANRTGDQASKAMSAVFPARPARRAPGNGLMRVASGTRGLAVGTQLLRRVPPSTRFAWRAGKATGRVQGAATLAPYAARGWWYGTTGRLQARTAVAWARAVTWWAPITLAATQLAARLWSRAPRGARAVAQVSAKATGTRAAVDTRAAQKAAKATTKAMAQRTRAAGRGVRISRPQPRAALASTQRSMRRGWRWVRFFTIGIAVGAIWAYLFAPRRGPGFDLMQQAGQGSRSA
jgi:hypothetical protein